MKRNTRGTKMLEAARKELEREAQAAKYKTPPTKAPPTEAPPAPKKRSEKRNKLRQCQFV